MTTAAPAPSPFRAFTEVGVPADADKSFARDPQGRVLLGAKPAYEYIDASSTYLSALLRDLVPLLEPDPKLAHETVMDLLGGFTVVAGQRNAGKDSIHSYDGNQVAYRGFREDQSPVLDLVHAVGQVLADPSTDDTLALVQRLAQDKPQVLARLVGAGFRIKEIADKHPEAQIPAASTLWDEMLDVLVEDRRRSRSSSKTSSARSATTAPSTSRSRAPHTWRSATSSPTTATT